MLPHTALNNFSKAFRALANQGLGKRRWLCGKYVQQLCDLEVSAMPEAQKRRFIRFKQDMETVRKSCKAESYRLAVESMDDTQVIEITARILAMHEALVHEASVDLLAHRTGGWNAAALASPIDVISPEALEGEASEKGQP